MTMTATSPVADTTPIAAGSVAPEVVLPDQDKKEWKLSSFKGQKPVVMFWYPLDWSPTCTKENACFSADLSKFSKYAEVVAISIDSVWSHKAWQEKMGLKHRLLADMHRKATKDYGLFFPAANISQRATVIVDKQGKVAWVHVEKNLGDERDYAKVEEQLKKLS